MPKTKVSDLLVKKAYSRSIIEQKLCETMVKVPDAARRIGMSESGFYRKKRNPETYTLRELAKLAEILHMTDEDIIGIVRGRKTA